MNRAATYPATLPGRSTDPWPIVWVIRGLIALIALHLAVPAVMVLQRGTIADGIRLANPALSAEAVARALAATIVAAVVFHLLFVALYAWLAGRIGAGRRWARVVLTVTLLVATAASLVSFTLSPLFRLLIPLTDLLQLVLIGLLWYPQPAREHFAAPIA